MKDDIVAIATSTASKAGINIIRISGANALKIKDKIFTSKTLKDKEMVPNMMYLGTIKGKDFLEQALCVYFKGPQSYTGEDVIEIHCHGGLGVTNATLRLCIEKGASPAEPGEFTKRAFLNGKINLSQAEGVREVINAEAECQIMQSYKLLSGEISQTIYSISERLIKTVATLEVRLDYPEETADEEDQPLVEEITDIIKRISKLLKDAKLVKVLNEGLDIAIVGLPNVGKSSLLNGLLMTDRAIVTEYEGTTRDIIKESIEIRGIKVNILDTAGIRESGDGIERIGVERSKEAIKEADAILFVMDLTRERTREEEELEASLNGKKVIRIANKKDKKKYVRENAIEIKATPPRDINRVKEEIIKLLDREKMYSTGIITSERSLACLREAKRHLERALLSFDEVPVECLLIDLREAYNQLAKITGENISDKILEEVFSTFCVGK